MLNYAFGAGGFKLGERVEVLTTRQRGILISEVIHISGCNTYLVLLPNVVKDGKMAMTHRDYLMLRKLEPCESIFDGTKELTEENSFSVIGLDVSTELLKTAISEQKEFIPEADDAVDIEEIAFLPGMEVWNKIYGKTMIISYISREIFSKQLEYGAIYMADDKEIITSSWAYAFIPIEQKLNINLEDNVGPGFEDGRSNIITRSEFFINTLKEPWTHEKTDYGL